VKRHETLVVTFV